MSFADVALNGSLLLAIPVALLAGMVSFASPCVVPLVPGYLGYVSGMAGANAGEPRSRARMVVGVLLFIAGFTTVFVLLGATVGSLGSALQANQDVILRVMGLVVIVMGFAFMGNIPWLQNESRWHVGPSKGWWGAPLLGFAFGLGWTPCIGPTLSAVLALSLDEATAARGVVLAIAYGLGLGLPFLALAFAVTRSSAALSWLTRHRRALMVAGGGMLVVLGVLLATGAWQYLTGLMQGWVDGFWVAV